MAGVVISKKDPDRPRPIHVLWTLGAQKHRQDTERHGGEYGDDRTAAPVMVKVNLAKQMRGMWK